MRRITLVAAALVGAGLSLPVAFARPARPVRLVPTIDAAQPEPAPPAVPSLQSTPAETTWIGGTHWDPVDQRWEANVGGVWTFESGVASAINTDPLKKPVGYHSLLEGWTSREAYTDELTPNAQRFQRRARSEFAPGPSCVGSDAPPLGGNWSLCAGLTEAEAETACYAGGQGYGSFWNIGVSHDFSYTSGDVVLSFDYRCESEPGFDFGSVMIYPSATAEAVTPWIISGSHSGHASVTLHPGAELPMTPGTIRVDFHFDSDTYDDQDGGFPTVCGGFAVDNIRLTGGVTYFTDLEGANDGWVRAPIPAPTRAEDYADIRAVSTLPAEPATAGCSFGDSVLTFIAPNGTREHSHPCWQRDIVISPWIDLEQAGIHRNDGVVFQAGGAYDLNGGYSLYLQLGAQADPDTCPLNGTLRHGDMEWLPNLIAFNAPVCSSAPGVWTRNLGSLVDGGADRFRLGISLVNLAIYSLCDVPLAPNSTPWLDNIRVGVIHGATSGVGPGPTTTALAGVTAVAPNPWSGGSPLVIRYRTPDGAPEPARFDILDVAGRVVRSFEAAGTRGAEGETRWDGRDAAGRLVAGGIYFVRLGRGGSACSRKLVVSR